jgi:hypothetical protein
MYKFLRWFFGIYWVIIGIMCFTGAITLTPTSTGIACLIASTAFWNDLF